MPNPFSQSPDRPYSVACATTANITLSGLQTIDGYTTLAGDLVLVKNQTTGSQNYVYVANANTWGRAIGFYPDNPALATAMDIPVRNGTVNGGTIWALSTTGTITIGTTTVTFIRIDGAWDEWKTLWTARGTIAAATAAGTYVMEMGNAAVVSSAAAMDGGSAFFPLDSAQYAVTGKTPQVRIVASVANNGTAPAANFTFHLYSFTLAAMVPTLTAAVGEQPVVITAPAANAQVPAYGAAFSMPATTGQGFLLGVVTSALIGALSAPILTASLQVRAT